MQRRRLLALAVLVLAGLVAAGLAAAQTKSTAKPPVAAAANGCELQSANAKIKHVIYIVFDNVHFRRDNPNARPTSSRCRTCSTSCARTAPSTRTTIRS